MIMFRNWKLKGKTGGAASPRLNLASTLSPTVFRDGEVNDYTAILAPVTEIFSYYMILRQWYGRGLKHRVKEGVSTSGMEVFALVPATSTLSLSPCCKSLLEFKAWVKNIQTFSNGGPEPAYEHTVQTFSAAVIVIQHYYKGVRTVFLSLVVCLSLKCDSGVMDNCTAIVQYYVYCRGFF